MSLPYDPDQNIEEKRDVRKQYRKIQTDIESKLLLCTVL